jgi:hypothetical protein
MPRASLTSKTVLALPLPEPPAKQIAKIGAAPYIVDRVLGRRQTGMVAVYDRCDRLPEMASALNAWAGHVERLVGGEERHADVVP